MKILITGANGRLGTALCGRLGDHHRVVPLVGETAPGVHVELTRWSEVHSAVEHFAPDFIIHTAAWTDVDGCARDPERALRVNGLGTQYLAAASGARGIPMLYISSNEVFDGTAARPYNEYDPTHPINPYGYSKWVGEQAVIRHNPQHMIVRTAWLFAHGGRNFVQSILSAARAGKPLRVVRDEVGSPTYTDDLADAVAALIGTRCWGTYHLTNSGTASRCAFAQAVLQTAGIDATIEPITLKEWPRPSTPPPYTPLANHAGAALGITLRPWQEALAAFLKKEEAKHA
jgi:dTDP-4-dehydrorhamnose reductase